MKTGLITISFFLLILTQPAKLLASHAVGADLSYECLSNDSFRITLAFYRDCDGIAAPTNPTVDLRSDSCGVSGFSITLDQQASQEVSPVCFSQMGNTSCNGGTLPGFELYYYSATIHLPAQCPDWIISYTLCCRSDLITNLSTPGSYNLYTETSLDNLNGACNNSPSFSSLPITYACTGQPFTYNLNAFDVDGDSLAFSLTNPLDGPGIPIPYFGGLSPSNPLDITGSFVFDSLSGQMNFTPTGSQVSVITVLVEEYQNGVLIGSSIREIFVVVVPCSGNNPPAISAIQNNTGGILQDSLTIATCIGDSIAFQFAISDTNSLDSISISSNLSQIFPGASLTTTGSGNNLTGLFQWFPAADDGGTYSLFVTANDNTCPFPATASGFFHIIVFNNTLAGPDQSYCPGGAPVQLNATGGTIFSWSPATGLSDPTIRNPVAKPTTTTAYTVTSNLASCNNSDTVVVNVVPLFFMQTSVGDTICRNGSAELKVITDSLYAPYSYEWSPANSLSNAFIANPTAFPLSTTTYMVSATSSNGCARQDSVEVTVSGEAPRVNVIADKNPVCIGDTVQLEASINPLECGPTQQGCSGPALPKTYSTPGAAQAIETPFEGASEDAKFQALYRASDLLAAGFASGTITAMELEVTSKASTGPYQNLTIRMGCTNANQLNINSGWQSNGSVVFDTTSFSISLGINTFSFSTPYDWDGLSNLFIEICYNNGALADAGGNDWLVSIPTNYSASMRAYNDNAVGCTLSPSFTYNQVPQITFHICPTQISQYTSSWSPSISLINPGTLSPLAIISEPTQFTFTVQDSLCESFGSITVGIDTSHGIETSNDTTICIGNTTPLEVFPVGTPPSSILNCGVNGTICSTAQLDYQIGSGSNTTTNGTPYEGFWEDGRVQYLIRASELQSSGMTASGTITALAFNVLTKNSTSPYDNFTIKLGCTQMNDLPNSFISSGLSIVYGPTSYNTSLGWNTHILSDPFNWDGSSNLIVEICFDNNNWSGADDVAYTFTTGTTVLYDFTDGSSGCSLSTPDGSSNRANITFTFCAAQTGTPSINWVPSSSLSDPNVPNPIASPTSTTTYHVEYDFFSGCSFEDSVTVTVNPNNVNISVSNDTSICAGASVLLNVSGGDSYHWDSLPGLSCYNCPDPVASPLMTTTYEVVTIDTALGCGAHDSVTITIFPNPTPTVQHEPLVCQDDSLVLDAGSGYLGYQWNTGQTTQSILTTSIGSYSVTVQDQNRCFGSDTVDTQTLTDDDCVWPGDANYDGVVNVNDVLAIGIGYSNAGYQRQNASLNWEGQACQDWLTTLANGTDYKHVDCDGNGIINSLDTAAVSLNYGFSHNKNSMAAFSTDPALYFMLVEDTVGAGEDVEIGIYLGRDALQVTDFYGISFEVQYDNAFVTASSVNFKPVNSFAGTPAINTLSFDKDFYQNSTLDAAITRYDQSNASGWGQIGTFNLHIRDTIQWNGTLVKQLPLSLNVYKAIDRLESTIPITGEDAMLYITRDSIPIGISSVDHSEINIYPNPTKDKIIIASGSEMITQLSVFNILGKKLIEIAAITDSRYTLDVSFLANGNYLIKGRTNTNGKDFIKKVVILR